MFDGLHWVQDFSPNLNEGKLVLIPSPSCKG